MKISYIKKIIESISHTDYFKQSLTHLSYCHERNLPDSLSYENLEFLGDSILNFQTCFYIFSNFPEFNEGKMSKLKQLMIQEKTLATISREIDLAHYIQLGLGEKKNNGSCKDSILADIFESFIAALFLTKGHKMTYKFLQLTLFSWIKGKEDLIWDYKTQLQEYCQTHKNAVIYKLLETKLRKNKFLFIVTAEDKLNTFKESGQGKNKKEAEQNAAHKVLEKLGLLGGTP